MSRCTDHSNEDRENLSRDVFHKESTKSLKIVILDLVSRVSTFASYRN